MDPILLTVPGSSETSESNPAKQPTRLETAAKQFEALMIEQMMKTARETSGGWLSEGDETGEDSSMSMAEAQFAQAMASNGGLGLAKMVVRTMSHVASKGDHTAALPAAKR